MQSSAACSFPFSKKRQCQARRSGRRSANPKSLPTNHASRRKPNAACSKKMRSLENLQARRRDEDELDRGTGSVLNSQFCPDARPDQGGQLIERSIRAWKVLRFDCTNEFFKQLDFIIMTI